MCIRLTATVAELPLENRSTQAIGVCRRQREVAGGYSAVHVRGVRQCGSAVGGDDVGCGAGVPRKPGLRCPREIIWPPETAAGDDLLHNRRVQPSRSRLVARLHVDLMRVASAISTTAS
jgi:hypothetical protein